MRARHGGGLRGRPRARRGLPGAVPVRGRGRARSPPHRQPLTRDAAARVLQRLRAWPSPSPARQLCFRPCGVQRSSWRRWRSLPQRTAAPPAVTAQATPVERRRAAGSDADRDRRHGDLPLGARRRRHRGRAGRPAHLRGRPLHRDGDRHQPTRRDLRRRRSRSPPRGSHLVGPGAAALPAARPVPRQARSRGQGRAARALPKRDADRDRERGPRREVLSSAAASAPGRALHRPLRGSASRTRVALAVRPWLDTAFSGSGRLGRRSSLLVRRTPGHGGNRERQGLARPPARAPAAPSTAACACALPTGSAGAFRVRWPDSRLAQATCAARRVLERIVFATVARACGSAGPERLRARPPAPRPPLRARPRRRLLRPGRHSTRSSPSRSCTTCRARAAWTRASGSSSSGPGSRSARYPGDHVEVSKGRQVLFLVRDGKVALIVQVSTGAHRQHAARALARLQQGAGLQRQGDVLTRPSSSAPSRSTATTSVPPVSREPRLRAHPAVGRDCVSTRWSTTARTSLSTW